VVNRLLEDLVDRGLDLKRRYLVVIDGSKALRAGVERVFGEQVEVQRCQIHKRRNVKEYLPENCQKDYDRRMRNAYAMNNYAARCDGTHGLIDFLLPDNHSNSFQVAIRIADQPDVMAESGWLLGYDHQSTAWQLTLPSALNVRKRYLFRVYLKVLSRGIRHHSLKGFEQNVARGNARSAKKC